MRKECTHKKKDKGNSPCESQGHESMMLDAKKEEGEFPQTP